MHFVLCLPPGPSRSHGARGQVVGGLESSLGRANQLPALRCRTAQPGCLVEGPTGTRRFPRRLNGRCLRPPVQPPVDATGEAPLLHESRYDRQPCATAASAVRRQEKQQADENVTRNLCCALDYARSLRTLRGSLASQQLSTSLIRRRDAVFLRVGKCS